MKNKSDKIEEVILEPDGFFIKDQYIIGTNNPDWVKAYYSLMQEDFQQWWKSITEDFSLLWVETYMYDSIEPHVAIKLLKLFNMPVVKYVKNHWKKDS